MSNELDVLRPENLKRMSPSLVQKDPDEIISDFGEMKILGIVRKMSRNNSQIKGWIKQYYLNVIGTGQKPIFNSKSKDFNEKAAALYRRKSKNWEGRDFKTRYESNRLALVTAFREGEVFCFYDAAGIMNKGKFFYYTRDYMPMINAADFKKHSDNIKRLLIKDAKVRRETTLKQTKGLILNQHGVTLGYIVANKPSLNTAKYDPQGNKSKVVIFKHSRNTKLVKMTDEFSKHGFSELLALATDVDGIKRLQQAYIRKVELQARIAVAFYVDDPIDKQRSRAAAEAAALGEELLSREAPSLPVKQYEELAAELELQIEYLSKDEKIEFKALLNGESKEIEQVNSLITTQGGFGLGFARMFSSGSSDKASFAGLMAESNITRALFDYSQKFFEREVLDFEIEAVIQDEIEKKNLPVVEDWDAVHWSGWPKIQSLNPLQDMKTRVLGIQAGLLDPNLPDYKPLLEKLAKMKEEAEELGLNLEIFSAVDAVVEQVETEEDNLKQDEENA